MFRLKYIITSIVFCLCLVANLHAEFLETSPNVFQHVNGKYKIIITSSGIFAIQTQKIDPKNFSTKDLTKDKVISSCFIRYSAEDNRYQELYINNTLYMIDGTFNLKLGDLSINVDELNTYISFVVYDKEVNESEQGILGVIGTSVVTNTTGSAFVALLEANLLSANDKNSTLVYTIDKNLLKKDNKEVQEGAKIGVKIDKTGFKNSCIADDAVILDTRDLELVKKYGASKNTKAIEDLFNSKKSKDIVKDLLIIRVEDSSVILLDYINANVKIAKKLGESSISNKTLCVIKNIDID